MPRRKQMLKGVLAIMATIAIIAIGGSILQSMHVRSEAEALLERSRHLGVGSSSYEQVMSTLSQFQRYQSSNESCSSGECELRISF